MSHCNRRRLPEVPDIQGLPGERRDRRLQGTGGGTGSGAAADTGEAQDRSEKAPSLAAIALAVGRAAARGDAAA
jgi:hypothetical protein